MQYFPKVFSSEWTHIINDWLLSGQVRFSTSLIREYGSTLYVGMVPVVSFSPYIGIGAKFCNRLKIAEMRLCRVKYRTVMLLIGLEGKRPCIVGKWTNFAISLKEESVLSHHKCASKLEYYAHHHFNSAEVKDEELENLLDFKADWSIWPGRSRNRWNSNSVTQTPL